MYKNWLLQYIKSKQQNKEIIIHNINIFIYTVVFLLSFPLLNATAKQTLVLAWVKTTILEDENSTKWF